MRKKKALAGVLTSALVLGSLTLPTNISFGELNFGTLFAQAAEVVDSGTCGDNLTWTLDEEGTLTISGSGAMDGEYYYTEKYDYINNVGTETTNAPWGNYSDDIISVVIEEGVTYIGPYAFYGCSNIASVKASDSVTSIGVKAFYGCGNLSNIEIPSASASIDTFYGCTKLIDDDGFLIIGNTLYAYYGDATELKIPAGITKIDNYAFDKCTSLTSVEIPDSVTSIGNSAFSECTALTSIKINGKLTYLGSGAFDDTGYYADESNWEDNVLYLDTYLLKADSDALEGNYSVKEGTTLIANRAFYFCSHMTSIVIPESVTAIGNSAFLECSSLHSIDLPDSLETIGNSAFYGSGLNSIEIPSGVTTIGNSLFQECYYLKSVTIPDGVTSIGTYAFWGCSKLSVVNIPDTVTTIGEFAFWGCSSIEDITIPNGVTLIDQFTFFGCRGLTNIKLPASVTYIGQNAINLCTNLADVYYSGSEDEFSQITIDEDNDSLLAATIHYNSYTPNTSEAGTNYDLGDVNNDGTINYLDAMQVLRYDAELATLDDDQLSAGDVNGDGSVNSLDAILILRYDAGLIEEF